MTARAKMTLLAKRTQFYKHSRKQNHASAIAHPCLRGSALAGKVKPRDYAICVPLKYRAARKTSAVSPLCGRARGVVLKIGCICFVSSKQMQRAKQKEERHPLRDAVLLKQMRKNMGSEYDLFGGNRGSTAPFVTSQLYSIGEHKSTVLLKKIL